MKLAYIKEFTVYYWTCPYCNHTNSDNIDVNAYSDIVCSNCLQQVKSTHEESEQGEEY